MKRRISFLACGLLSGSAFAGAELQMPILMKVARFFSDENGVLRSNELIWILIYIAAGAAVLFLIALFWFQVRCRQRRGKSVCKASLSALLVCSSMFSVSLVAVAVMGGYRYYRQHLPEQPPKRETKVIAEPQQQVVKTPDTFHGEDVAAKPRGIILPVEMKSPGQVADFTLAESTEPMVLSAAVSADGSKIVAVGGRSGDASELASDLMSSQALQMLATVVDASTFKTLLELDGHGSTPVSVSVSPDGKRAATAALDGMVRIWNLADGKLLKEFTAHSAGARAVVYSPNGLMLITGGMGEDGTVRVWNAETNERLREYDGFKGGVSSLSVAPDGHHVAVGSDGVTVLDLVSGVVKEKIPAGAGRTLTVGYSPDGHYIAAGGRDNFLRIWDAKSFMELQAIPAHNGQVNCLAWTDDSKRLLTGGNDGKMRVWDAPTGKMLQEFKGEQNGVTCVVKVPGQDSAFSFCMIGKQYKWDLAKSQEVIAAAPAPHL